MLLSTGALLPTRADAGSLTLSSDKLVVSQGEIFTITVRGVIEDGDPTLPGGLAFFSYDPNIVLPLGQTEAAEILTSFSGAAPWIRSALEGSCSGDKHDPNYCRAIDQITFPSIETVDPTAVVSRFSFQAIAPSGNVAEFEFRNFIWFGELSGPGGATSRQYGYEANVSLPGISVTISPEPTTGALLLFGLGGLALGRRRVR
ncbi:MAG: PEP-CTERM sorting domain-containing protein [Myxococcota bacterium]